MHATRSGLLHIQRATGVPLGIEIQKKGGKTHVGKAPGKIDADRRLPHPPLLIGNSNACGHFTNLNSP